MLRKFLRDESGATAIEYGLIAGLIALAISRSRNDRRKAGRIVRESYSRVDSLGLQVGSIIAEARYQKCEALLHFHSRQL